MNDTAKSYVALIALVIVGCAVAYLTANYFRTGDCVPITIGTVFKAAGC